MTIKRALLYASIPIISTIGLLVLLALYMVKNGRAENLIYAGQLASFSGFWLLTPVGFFMGLIEEEQPEIREARK